ncbi:MAG: D-tyrosyl-tRNA(Tyr) deacylase [Candidatus Woesebacteria bacterium GW2011_GWA1_37_7]|uniref:D-tyrosyl-tRNA(Tyr) deacylase n=1 Tax=Candidatus Woesebacteria bacterium GW2011_GWA1_37_7 TaxID=1618545 RepID=A0A0G0H2F8_9BACT|nr:MAG: D-tyrosyl-tRNA(Tyr) deacylase [Candidatus Woesebacteria bacterium GW2011_GWA1_37_7]
MVDTGEIAGKIETGLLVLVGVGKGDSNKDAEVLSEKLSKLRIISDNQGKMNLSLLDAQESVLAVSQFTLYADTSAGNRPSFIKAAEPKLARSIYNHFILKLKEKGLNVETGSFGEYMEIIAKLDGPVTIILESSSQ